MNLFADWDDICRHHVPLADLTWFKLGGAAEYFAQPRSIEQLAGLIKQCRKTGTAIRFLGLGANLLVSDEGVQGLVIQLSDPAFSFMRIEGETLVVGAGMDMTRLVKASVRQGLAGLEQLAGIPGTVGGGVFMNCGGRYGDISQSLHSVTSINTDGEIRVREKRTLGFEYRRSLLGDECVVSATFEMQSMDPSALDGRFREIWAYKQASQPPLGACSAGCIFKNPEGTSAGLLIDRAGLKGFRLGSAFVSDRHANFIMADAGGRAGDVMALIELVRERVLERMGIEMETEVKIWSEQTDAKRPKVAASAI